MKETIIINIPKDTFKIKELQKKLFSQNIFWKENDSCIREIKDHSNSSKLIFIIDKDNVLSWTTDKYGYPIKKEYNTKTYKEVMN